MFRPKRTHWSSHNGAVFAPKGARETRIKSCTPRRPLGPSGPRGHAGAGPTPRPSHSAVQRANRGAGAGPKPAHLRVTLSTRFF